MARYLKVTIEVIEESYDNGITISGVRASHPQRWLISTDRNRADTLEDVARVTTEVSRDLIEEFS